MRKEYLLVGLILIFGLLYRVVDGFEILPPESSKYIVLTQLIFLVLYCALLFSKENRTYIRAILIFLIIGFVGDIMDNLHIAGSTYFMLFSEIAHLLIMVQLILDNQKLKDSYLIAFSSIISAMILTQYILTLSGNFNAYLLHPLALMFGLLLIFRKNRMGLVAESYLKVFVLQYSLGSMTTAISVVKN